MNYILGLACYFGTISILYAINPKGAWLARAIAGSCVTIIVVIFYVTLHWIAIHLK